MVGRRFWTTSLPILRHTLRALPAALLVASLALPHLEAQTPKKPLTQSEVLELLKGDVPSTRVGEIARGRGISFAMTSETESELRDAGATEELIKTLRQLAPKPQAPAAAPVLLIEATPGGAQVYVDDEPVGTTSPEGRLKLTRFSPGAHRVRLSLEGYRDVEQPVTLEAGQTARVTAALEAGSSPAPPSSPPSANPTTAAASGTATLSFPVVHDHGPPPPNYCTGIMTIGNGRVAYRSMNGIHSFEIPVSAIKEAKKNAVYLAAYGGFHIKLKKGTIYNFAVIDPLGQFQPPDALLSALDQAMGK